MSGKSGPTPSPDTSNADVLAMLDRIEKGETTKEDRQFFRDKNVAVSRGFFGSLAGVHAVDHIRLGTAGDVTEGITDLLGRAAIGLGIVGAVLTGTGHLDVSWNKA